MSSRVATDQRDASGRHALFEMAVRPETYDILGVRVTDLSVSNALALLESIVTDREGGTRNVFFVNAHTLNTAARHPEYARLLNGADYVFGDGTGVRWATRMIHGRALEGNVNGTDMTPALFDALAGRGLRYYLLGATAESIERAAATAQEAFAGWTLAGYHHGYLAGVDPASITDRINAAEPDMLLVGMGNPLQETWLAENKHRLKVPLCMGTGGLFTYWAGDLDRAPSWMRRLGIEWLHLLRRQPSKARRYVLGNPAFLARAARQRLKGSR